MKELLRTAGELSYRFGLGPQPSDVPDHRLVELVEGPDRMPPGRALDLGTATGRNAHYLARHGWDTTGVEMLGEPLRQAEQAAERAGLAVRFVRGDVTRLPELDLGARFDLLMDGGCYHMIPAGRRESYVDSVTAVAAPGAVLILVGFTRHLGLGVSRDEIEQRFTGWTLLAADPVPGEQMRQYVRGPAPLRFALGRGLARPWRFQLRYDGTG